VFTVVFAIGQAIGPVLTGWLADVTQSLQAGLAGSVAILLAASAAAMYQRERKTAEPSSSLPAHWEAMARNIPRRRVA
jgi:MFS family permease